MKCGIIYLLFAGILTTVSYGHAGETPLGNFPKWGESIERVIGERHIAHPFMEESTSLLFNIPVQVMLTRELVGEQKCTVLYSFLNNKLIEYVLHLEDSADTGDTIRTQLERQYEKYTGPLFFYDEDVFVDKAGKTCVFLLKDEDGDTFLYFLDMVTYASIKGNG
ncbi:hypothetical protein [uncultured Mailhella sp.]|uniref:hypothetical protein n=1 Tax=uncultured Mailhella sp. TaxID=1981031 RepID=UPI0032083210